MKFLKYNRTAAILCLIAAVLLSIPLGMHRSLSSLSGKVEKVYAKGSDRYGTVREDLAKATDYAENLYAIYAAVYGADTACENAIRALRETDSPIGAQDAFSALMRQSALMYQKLNIDTSLAENQKRSAVAFFYEIESTEMRLAGNEEYEKAADRYNRACRSFPASLLSRDEAMQFAS